MHASEASTLDIDPLSSAQVAEINRTGFLVLGQPQIAASDINWCRSTIMRMIERRVGVRDGRSFDVAAREGGDGRVSLGLFRPSLYAPELSHWQFRRTGLGIAKQLLGPDATFAADNVVFKPRKVGGGTAWHQDEAYNDPLSYQRQVTLWIAMSDTTAENGALEFIPGSHTRGILPHQLHGGAKSANAIECCGGFDPSEAKICPIPAGAMTIHLGRTLHGARPNTSDTERLGYILNYKTPPEAHPELGSLPWNKDVARAVHSRRKRWLMRGGALVELMRFMFANQDDKRFLLKRLRDYLPNRFAKRSDRPG